MTIAAVLTGSGSPVGLGMILLVIVGVFLARWSHQQGHRYALPLIVAWALWATFLTVARVHAVLYPDNCDLAWWAWWFWGC